MKMLTGIIAVTGLCFSINSFAQNMDSCISIQEVWGKSCGSADSFQVKIKNQCSEAAYAKTCLERTNGKWSCGSTTLKPGDVGNGAWICEGTGKYKYATCTGGYKECGFESP